MSSNEERIAQWRARRDAEKSSRAAHPDLPSEFALIATRAEALATGDREDADGVLALVLESLRSMPSTTIGERRQVYDAVARGIERGVEHGDAQSEFAELRRRQLRTIVRLVENDARLDIAVTDPGYRPAEFDDAVGALLSGYRRRRALREGAEGSRLRRQALLSDESFTISVSEEDEGDLLYLRQRLAVVDAARGRRSIHQLRPRLDAWRALLRFEFALLRAESRFALLWSLLGPAVLMGILSFAYFFIGTHTILNMDVPTFAMIGGATWFMLRNTMFRTSTGFINRRSLHNFEAVTPAMTGISVGMVYLSSYSVVFPVLILGGYAIDLFTLPANVGGVVFWIACTGAIGLAIGSVFGCIAVVWPYFRQLGPVIQRSLMVVSGTFLVSEQLPTDYRAFILWSPLTHALQLLRTAYFENYTSDDADPEFFFAWLGALIVVGAVGQRLIRSRSNPA